MSDYAAGAEFYDLLYAHVKDYGAEATLLDALIRAECPHAQRLLDVGCGTGAHAHALSLLGYSVDGVDIEPAFVQAAQQKCPAGRFYVGDMTALDLPERYDVVLSLFSAIGYVRDRTGLDRAIRSMAAHLKPDGVLIIDPWFEPGQLTHGHVSMLTAETDALKVCRVSRTLIDGVVSVLDFAYLVGRATGIEHLRETHRLGLFTQPEMETALRNAGLSTIRRMPRALRTRGIYIGAHTVTAGTR
jgi:SAM-dependent methyltransferase